MWFHTLFASWKSGRSRSRRHAGTRLLLEQLEDRAVPAAFIAYTAADLVTDVTAANAMPGTNTITLAAATTAPYVLTVVDNSTDGPTGLPVIAANDNLTILGNGDTIERSTASGTPAFRLFDVAAGASLTLQSLTLQGGLATGAGVSAEGGAIYSQGALTLNGVTVQDNQAVGSTGVPGLTANAGPGGNAFGGGLYMAGGTAMLSNTTLSSNSAEGGVGGSTWYDSAYKAGAGGNGFGGGMEVAGGTVMPSSATLSANVAQGGQGGSGGSLEATGGNGYGGGMEVAGGMVTLNSAALSANVAAAGPGGDYDTFYSGYAYGGALQVNGGSVSLTGTTLSSNTAEGRSGYGGALQVNSGTVSLITATLSSNTALGANNAYIGGYGFGEDGFSYALSEGGPGDGGALQVSGGTVGLSGATLSSNTAQGGYGYYGGATNGGALQVSGGTVSLTSTLLSANTAQAGSDYGYGGNAYGGALQVSSGTLVLATVTLSSNTAQGGNCDNGEVGWAGSGYGGALEASGGAVSVTNTTVSSNSALGGTPSDDGGSGSGGGLDITSPAIVYLDSFTVAHTYSSNNTDSTGLNGSSANIDGGYSLLNTVLQPPTVVTAASAAPALTAGTTTSLSVLGSDPDNGTESDLTYTWTVTSGPAGGAAFSSNRSNAAKNTTVTFHDAGTYTFKVTLADSYHLTADSSVTVTVNQTETSISVSPTTVSLDWGATRKFAASARDQFGQAMTNQPAFTWTVAAGGAGGSVSSSGLYTAPRANGSDTVIATDSSANLSGTAAVTVLVTPPEVLSAASSSANPVTGTTANLSVYGYDADGDSSLAYTWAVTPAGAATPTITFASGVSNGTNGAQNATATFYQAGTYTFQATITNMWGLTTVSSVAVTVNQTLTSIDLSPANVTLAVHGQQSFQASAFDQFGQTMAAQPSSYTWSIAAGGIGSINNKGQYTAPNSGTGTAIIQATAAGITGTASVTIEALPPVITQSASAKQTTVTGTQTQLQVQASDPQGAKLSYAWSVTSLPKGAPAPTFNNANSNNTTVTFHEAGSYTFTVTITDALGLASTSSVTVTVAQTLSSLSLAPANLTVANGASEQFTAMALDQFGQALVVQPAFTWQVNGGTISSTGLFTAPKSGTGKYQVKVSADGLNAQANVTVT